MVVNREELRQKLSKEEPNALGISSVGNYAIFRNLYNVDIPQDITTFRQIQEKVNEVEGDIEKRYEGFYQKMAIDNDKFRDLKEEGLKVLDFVPTAGIIRVNLPEGRKLDILATYPFDDLKYKDNLFILGKGEERVEEEFEGELLYDEDLRDKRPEEVVLINGLDRKKVEEIVNTLKNEEAYRDLKEHLEENYDIDFDREGEALKILKALKDTMEAVKEDKSNPFYFKIKALVGDENFEPQIKYTVADLIEDLQRRGQLEGEKLGGYLKAEFYPTNGIIIGENKDKELVFAFSPERLEWKMAGIGIAKMLNDFNYKMLNGLISKIQSKSTFDYFSLIEKEKLTKNEERKEFLRQKIEKIKGEKIDDIVNYQKKLLEAEKNYNVDEKLYELIGKFKEAISEEDFALFEKVRKEAKQYRNNLIREKVNFPKIDINDLLKKDFKYSDGEKKFLRWSLDEMRTPLGFNRRLYLATKGRVKNARDKKYVAEVRVFFSDIPKVIPISTENKDLKKGEKIEKKTDLVINSILKPIGFQSKNRTLDFSQNPLDARIKLNFENLYGGNRKEIKEFMKQFMTREAKKQEILRVVGTIIKDWEKEKKEKAIRIVKAQKVNSVGIFFRKLLEKENVKLKEHSLAGGLNGRINIGFGKYVETYLRPLKEGIDAMDRELKELLGKMVDSPENVDIKEGLNRYFRILSGGLRDGDKYIRGLQFVRDRVSNFKQVSNVYENLYKEAINYYKNILPEKLENLREKLVNVKSKEEREKMVKDFEKGMHPKFVKDFEKEMERYDRKEGYKGLIVYGSREERRKQILNKMSKGYGITNVVDFAIYLNTLNQIYKDVVLDIQSYNGLEKFRGIVEETIKELEKEGKEVAPEWKELVNEIKRRQNNLLKASLVKDNVGIEESIPLKEIKKLYEKEAQIIPNPNEKEIIEKAQEQDMLVELVIPENIKDIIEVKKNIPTAKGNTPLIFNDMLEMLNRIEDIIRENLKEGLKLNKAEVGIAYKYKDGYVPFIKMEVEGKEISYTPQPNKIPTEESFINRMKKLGVFEPKVDMEIEKTKAKMEEVKEAQKEQLQQEVDKEVREKEKKTRKRKR
jgi:hypothetical protein